MAERDTSEPRGRGWPKGRPRLQGGPVTKRITIAMTAAEERALQALAAEWSCPEAEAARRALLVAVDVLSGTGASDDGL